MLPFNLTVMRAARKARLNEWNLTMSAVAGREDFGVGAVLNALRMIAEI